MSSVSEMPIDTLPTKKPRSRKALKPKNNDANSILPESSPSLIASVNTVDKENLDALSQSKSKRKTKKGSSKAKKTEMSDFEKELQEMQEKLEKLQIEKEQTEETLKARDEALKMKEEELENREKEQEKLKCELKKLQKMKEFKPVMTLPFGISSKDQEQDKKEKKKVDPSKKKPSPPYGMWCKDQWNEVKKANPDADFKEMSGLLGAKWKTITAEEKKPYEEKYQAEKEAYLKVVGTEKREHEAMRLLEDEQKQKTAMDLLEQYLQFKQEAEKVDNKKKAKKEKDPLKPKKPMSAYFLFSKERGAALRAENKTVLEVAKITGEEWNKMSEKQKTPFEQMALKLKEQYMQEMEVYNQNKDEEATNLKKEEEELQKLHKQEAMQLLKKKEKTDNLIKKTKEERQKQKKEKNVDPNKPKKPASSFFLFSKETRKCLMEERPGINNSTITALISVKWKELGEEEKQVWNSKAAETMEVYKKELAAYNTSLAAEESQNKN